MLDRLNALYPVRYTVLALAVLGALLSLFTLVGFGIGGWPLGFWFAQQGSIYVFVGLIFFYAWRMNKLDKKFGLEE